MIDTSINKELLESYKSANYHVDASPSFILKIGKYSPELHSMYDASHKKRAAFITAFNPASVELSNEENKERNRELEEKQLIISSFKNDKGKALKNINYKITNGNIQEIFAEYLSSFQLPLILAVLVK